VSSASSCGIVEYRRSRQFPDRFAAYVHDRGHVVLAPLPSPRTTRPHSRGTHFIPGRPDLVRLNPSVTTAYLFYKRR
jgi:hypothetical protein